MRDPVAAACLPSRASLSLLALLACASMGSPAHARRPPFCSSVEPDRFRAQAGIVLVTTASADDAVSFDETPIAKGPVLVRNVAPGKHTVVITPITGAPLRREILVRGGHTDVIGLPNTSLSRAGAPLLSETSAGGFDMCDRTLLSHAPGPAEPLDAEQLARLRCDPALAPHLPTTASLLARVEAACTAGDAVACRRAGDQWSNDAGERERDSAKAAPRYRRGCELGDAHACGVFAESLEHGEGVPRDVTAAAAFRERACSGGDKHSCDRIGTALLATGADRDRARALPYLIKACEDGSYYVCQAAQRTQLQLSCARGDHEACELLAPDDPVRRSAEEPRR
jgi:hypothetical protein